METIDPLYPSNYENSLREIDELVEAEPDESKVTSKTSKRKNESEEDTEVEDTEVTPKKSRRVM